MMTTETPQSVQDLIKIADESQHYVLDLIGKGQKELPPQLGKLKKLRTLQLAYNQFSEIPEVVRALAGLEELDLTANNLTALPDWIGELSRLRTLRLASNRISELPETLGKLTALERLYVSDNALAALPDALFRLSELRFLILANNQLRQLPSDVEGLKQLRLLDISGNEINRLPAELGALGQLERLRARRNTLSDLPDSLRLLDKLVAIDLSANHFQQLPVWLKEMKGLRSLMLHENPDLRLPSQILGPAPRDAPFCEGRANARRILDYYYKTEVGAQELNEARLILVGRGYAGKTSLVKRLKFGSFKRGELRTDGIEITHWHPFPDSRDVVLNIWDFGGQEIMHATHQFFLSPNCLYLIVLNGREGLEDHDVAYWLKLVDSFAGDSPVIVVQNKICEQEFELNYGELRNQYPQIAGFQKTECSDGQGIEELKELIRGAIRGRMPFLKDKFPAAWINVKAELAKMRVDYLTYDAYRDLCQSHGIDDPEQQDNLAHQLHCLGVALNYKDDPRLRETSVLNPRWVTEGVYRVLTHGELARRHGELHTRDLDKWLDQARYPREKDFFLLELMHKFRLCFPFPDELERFLVPELLEKDRPDLGHRFDPEHCLNFEYHYSILPEGLLPQFIVRTHALSEIYPNWRWRTGVVIAWDDAEALVKAEPVERRIVVRVCGPSADGMRRLLAVVRADFDRIHRHIPGLDVDERVPLPEFADISVSYKDLLVYERQGYSEIPIVVGGKVVTADISDLLNGVDFGGVHARFRRTEGRDLGVRLFISYAPEDDPLKTALEVHLKILEQTGTLSIWSERRIAPGSERDTEIDCNLEQADIVLLLVSADFVASNCSKGSQMKRIMDRYESGESVVIPVILRDCRWQKAKFGTLKPLPKEGIPVVKWRHRDEAWTDVVSGIEEVIEERIRGSH